MSISRGSRSQTRPLRLNPRLVLAVAAVVVYLAGFPGLEDRVGGNAAAFSTVPVVVIGALFGIRAGIAAVILALPVNLLLFRVSDVPLDSHAIFDIAVGTLALSPVGAGAGWLHDLYGTTQTALVRAEQAQALYEATAENLVDGLAIVDRSERVVLWNPGMERLYGVPREDAVGHSFRNVIQGIQARTDQPVATRANAERALMSAMAGEAGTFQFRLLGPPTRDIETSVFGIRGSNGRMLGHGRLVRDVTSEREAARAREEITSIVSHELRAPLAAMLAYLDLLRTQSFPPEQQHEYLAKVNQEGQRLQELLDAILSVQRLERGHHALQLEPVAVEDIVADAVNTLEPDEGHPIHVDVSDDLPLVSADSAAVRQVLVNLLTNARKYSPRGGPIRIEAGLKGEFVEVAVEDAGLGIPSDAIPRLFEKFYRVQSDDRRNIHGTGLGLAISRAIVEQHGGSIWAESKGPGQGARFTFSLPLDREADAQ